MKTITMVATVGAFLLWTPAAPAQLKSKAARETAEVLFERFGAKAGRSVPELTGRIESIAASAM